MNGFINRHPLLFVGLVLLGGMALAFAAVAVSEPTPPAKVVEGSGSVDGRRFLYGMKDGKLAVTFQPFIPRNDRAFAASAQAVIRSAFGEEIDRTSMRLSPPEIAFNSPTRTYFVFPIKEDTGEVHSFVIRYTTR